MGCGQVTTFKTFWRLDESSKFFLELLTVLPFIFVEHILLLIWKCGSKTTHQWDNSWTRQLVNWQLIDETTHCQDNSLPRQLIDETTHWRDNSLMRQLIHETTRQYILLTKTTHRLTTHLSMSCPINGEPILYPLFSKMRIYPPTLYAR